MTIAIKYILAFQVLEKEFDGGRIHVDGGRHGPVANLTAFLCLQHALWGSLYKSEWGPGEVAEVTGVMWCRGVGGCWRCVEEIESKSAGKSRAKGNGAGEKVSCSRRLLT